MNSANAPYAPERPGSGLPGHSDSRPGTLAPRPVDHEAFGIGERKMCL